MLDSANELIFAEDMLFFNSDETDIGEIKEKWKILIVDDEPEVHNVTKMVLRKFEFEGRRLEFLSAFSGKEARALMQENPDIAVILLDVVMEEDDTGLKMIRFIRDELKNSMVRIILRTGQPGQAPEERVVIDYDINDYKEKTELTSQKIFTTIISSLRAYRDITTIDTSRKGLKGIVDTFSEIFFEQPIKDFASRVLSRLAAIIELCNPNCSNSSSFAAIRRSEDFYILAATGKYLRNEERKIQDVIDEGILGCLYKAYESRSSIYTDNAMMIYLKGMSDSESLIYFEGCMQLNDLTRELIEVFCSNVSAVNEAIINSNKYENEKQQRALSEKLRHLIRDLTSTLDLNSVLVKLLENLNNVIGFCRGMVVLTESECYRVLALMESGQVVQTDYILDEIECEIVSNVVTSLLPYSTFGLDMFLYEQKVWIQSCLAVPIMYQGELYGVILLQHTKTDAFSSKDENIALTYADQAGLAIGNASLFFQVTQRNADIKNLLDNAGQGFMTFEEDLLIDGEYSAECVNIFGQDVGGAKFSQLVYNDSEQQKYLEIMMQKILNIDSFETRERYLPLLPSEIYVNGKYVNSRYKVLEDPNDSGSRLFMVILTDISDKKLLENRIEKERNTLKMVVKAVTDHENLVKCIKDYEEFCKCKIYETFGSSGSVNDIVFEIMRKVHTFKGSFSQLDLINVVSKLHEFETELSELIECEDRAVIGQLKGRIHANEMYLWLKNDLDILIDVLGEEYFKYEKTIFIDQAKLMEIEKKIGTCYPTDEGKQLLADIRRLRYRPFREALKQYPAYVEKLALSLNKQVKPLAIDGGEFLVDIQRYEDFTRSLVHVFRNALDHGIETLEERKQKSKCEYASVRCTVSLADNEICLAVSDDGKGISLEKLRDSAIEKGLLEKDATLALSENQILDLVFEEFFTTQPDAGEYSGRGVGLASVRAEVEKLGGTVEVRTKEGEGTCFTFRFKYED